MLGSMELLTLPVQAEKIMTDKKLDKEYLGITGLPDFLKASAELAYGKNSKHIQENKVRYTRFEQISTRSSS
jgi:aspartate aminotransferase